LEPITEETTVVFGREASLYLDLLKKTLTRTVAPERLAFVSKRHNRAWKRAVGGFLDLLLAPQGYCLARVVNVDPSKRLEGEDWPADAETMIGMKRLDNIQDCIETILRDEVPGDVIETGVWRGGACIFMKALLNVAGDSRRQVWVADSFEGLPRPQSTVDQSHEYSQSAWKWEELRVSLEEVKKNFEKYGLLDDQVRFLKGWFKDVLPEAPIERLSLIRLDGDMYESTMDAVSALYPKLSAGGFVIVDDYYSWPTCKTAIHEYRERHGITEPIVKIDRGGAFWRRLS
jgi:O-methyltransferase